MNSKSGRIFLACALGAFIGSLVALQFGAHRWWAGLIGFITGGFVGYLSYEFKKVRQAITGAWRATKGYWYGLVEECRLSNSEVRWFFWRAMSTLAGSVSGFILIAALMILSLEPGKRSGVTVTILLVAVTALPIVSFILSVIEASFILPSINRINRGVELDIQSNRRKVLLFNPIVVYLYWMPKGIIWCLHRSPKATVMAVRFTAKFLKQLFFLIHSEERLLCGVDAAIGAVVGYMAGNALVGAAVGGVLGILNYEIISIRVLKLKPNRIVG